MPCLVVPVAERDAVLGPAHSITSSACARIEGGDRDAELCCRLEVHGQVESGRLFDRQITRSLALEDSAHIATGAMPEVDVVRTIGHKSAVLYIPPIQVHRRQSIASGELDDLRGVSKNERVA